MAQPTLVFDLDGTLVDTAPDLLDSLNHCLGCAGMRQASETELRRYVGMGGLVMIQRAFAAQNEALTDAHLAELHGIFLEHYTRNIPGRSRAFPGVVEAMGRFADAGYVLAVCTNKYEGLARNLLAGLALTDRFAAICGQDTFPFRKPDPRHLTLTIEAAGGNPQSALMVGDSRTDIDTAKAAGIPVVAVDFGYTDRHVSLFEPSRVISHFDELTPALAASLIGIAA